MTGDVVLRADRVSRTYRLGGGVIERGREIRAVDDVSLELRRNEVLGLIGESGCGKSTLSRLLLGLEKPNAGSVELDGRPMASLRRKDVARILQPVFQDPYSSLNPRETVEVAVSRPLWAHGIGNASTVRTRVEEAVSSVGLPRRALSSYPSQLSGGQRQRVAIARALVLRPRILICDEPTSALDVSVQAQILNLLNDLRAASDISLILISHNLQVVRFLADRVAVMYFGKIIESGAASTVLGDPQHAYTRRLLASALDVAPGAGLPPLEAIADS